MPNRSPSGGFVQAADARQKEAARIMFERRKKTMQAAGAPWRHTAVSRPEALARMQAWDDPTNQDAVKHAAQLSERETIAAALDAVKLREWAEKEGRA
jgi:hypothetical protein